MSATDHRKFCLVSGLLIFIFMNCQILKAALPDWIEQARTKDISDYPVKVAYVILYQSRECKIRSNGLIESNYRWGVKLHSREGTRLDDFIIPYRNGDQIDQIRAFQITEKGKINEFNLEDVIETTVLKEEFYSDLKQKVIQFKNVAPGHMLFVEYREKMNPFLYQMIYPFQVSRMPVLFSKFSLEMPSKWDYSTFLPIKSELVQQTIKVNQIIWECNSLPFIDEENILPPLYQITPAIYVKYFPKQKNEPKVLSDWNDFGNWIRHGWANCATPDSTIIKIVQTSCSEANSLWEKIKILNNFIQSNIRYLVVYEKTGRFIPPPVSEILRNRYGDCKAKSALLISMLSVLKIDAYPVLVTTKEEGTIYPEWPGSQFNHVIVAIRVTENLKMSLPEIFPALEKEWFFIDPTASYVRFGEIPWNIQDTHGVIVTTDSAIIRKLPLNPISSEMQIVKIIARIDDSGELTAFLNYRAKGNRGSSWSAFWNMLDPIKYKEVFLENFPTYLSGSRIDNFQINTHLPEDDDFSYTLEFKSSGYARHFNDQFAFNPNLWTRFTEPVLVSETRQYALNFNAPICLLDTVMIVLPSGFELQELPDDSQTKMSGLEYSSKYRVIQDKLWYFRKLKRTNSNFDIVKYDSIKAFYTKVFEQDNEPIVLEFNHVKGQTIQK